VTSRPHRCGFDPSLGPDDFNHLWPTFRKSMIHASKSETNEFPSAARNLERRLGAPPPVTAWLRKFDEASLQELMLHYRPLLHEIAKRNWNRRYQPRLDPSEALQLTWASVALQAPRVRFVNRYHFMVFLTKTLRNHLISIHRSLYAQKRSVTREIELACVENRNLIDPTTHESSVLDDLIEREFLSATLRAMLRLPRELQRLLRWRFRKGMTCSEIAVKIGCSESEVRHMIDRCIRSIGRELRQQPRIPR
jgi:RNA polymerase sigma factor (sigma-70 family)